MERLIQAKISVESSCLVCDARTYHKRLKLSAPRRLPTTKLARTSFFHVPEAVELWLFFLFMLSTCYHNEHCPTNEEAIAVSTNWQGPKKIISGAEKDHLSSNYSRHEVIVRLTLFDVKNNFATVIFRPSLAILANFHVTAPKFSGEQFSPWHTVDWETQHQVDYRFVCYVTVV